MGAELGLVGGHIDVDRTVALTALAAEAKIERLLHGSALPAIHDRISAQHLEQQARPAARAVALLERRHVARTHHATVARAPPAGTDADATQGRLREAAAVFGIREIRRDFWRLIIRPNTQIGNDRKGINHLPRIHSPTRIPDRLEFVECLDQMWAVHL